MKLTNYNGTKASQKAYDIQESIDLIRNETIPRLQENYFDLLIKNKNIGVGRK